MFDTPPIQTDGPGVSRTYMCKIPGGSMRMRRREKGEWGRNFHRERVLGVYVGVIKPEEQSEK